MRAFAALLPFTIQAGFDVREDADRFADLLERRFCFLAPAVREDVFRPFERRAREPELLAPRKAVEISARTACVCCDQPCWGVCVAISLVLHVTHHS